MKQASLRVYVPLNNRAFPFSWWVELYVRNWMGWSKLKENFKQWFTTLIYMLCVVGFNCFVLIITRGVI